MKGFAQIWHIRVAIKNPKIIVKLMLNLTEDDTNSTLSSFKVSEFLGLSVSNSIIKNLISWTRFFKKKVYLVDVAASSNFLVFLYRTLPIWDN